MLSDKHSGERTTLMRFNLKTTHTQNKQKQNKTSMLVYIQAFTGQFISYLAWPKKPINFTCSHQFGWPCPSLKGTVVWVIKNFTHFLANFQSVWLTCSILPQSVGLLKFMLNNFTWFLFKSAFTRHIFVVDLQPGSYELICSASQAWHG